MLSSAFTALALSNFSKVHKYSQPGLLFTNCLTLSYEVFDGRLDRVVAYGSGDSLGLDGRPFFGEDVVLNQRIGLMAQENAAKLSVRLQPRRQVHFAADDRIVHAVLTAEIADGTIARVDSDAQLERLLQSSIAPIRLQLSHSPLHRDGHVDASDCVFLDAPGLRIAEECQDRVADALVDSRAVGHKIVLTVTGSPPSTGDNPTARSPGISPTQRVRFEFHRVVGRPTLGTICALMQRRFAAPRHFTPLAVDGFLADPIVRMRIGMLIARAMSSCRASEQVALSDQ
jgi:hypothetical protein